MVFSHKCGLNTRYVLSTVYVLRVVLLSHHNETIKQDVYYGKNVPLFRK